MDEIKLVKMYMDEEIKSEVNDILDSGFYIKGPNLKKFENDFRRYLNVKYSIGVSSGTAGIFLAYFEMDFQNGDEVIVPSHTFISTVSPLAFYKARPVFVDIDPDTYCMDIEDVKEKITNKTRVIVPVHLYGHPVDMDPLLELAEDKNIKIIEDCCQAHGAEYKGIKVGNFGDIGIYSFFPSKNMTVGGDGGMIVTNNDIYEHNLSLRRDHGRSSKYKNDILGLNFRLNEIQAVIGRIQLKYLETWVNKRREFVNFYNQILKDYSNIKTPIEMENTRHSYYVYTIQMENRDKFIEHMKHNQIATGVYYPIPVHKQPVIEKIFGKQPKLPITEEVVNKIVSLPLSPLLNDEEINRIKLGIENFMRQ